MSLLRQLGKAGMRATALFLLVVSAEAQPKAPTRQPASKAGAILTWPEERRERYIEALDAFFLTRTVKAGRGVRALAAGPPLGGFENAGLKAVDVDGFMRAQRVRGVLVMQDGRIRFERYTSPHGPDTRWNSFSVAKSVTSTLVGAAVQDGYIRSLDEPVARYIKACAAAPTMT
jgi:CubicO group peptidase (beta-lactamase class C family)